jgi:hypothetical protein
MVLAHFFLRLGIWSPQVQHAQQLTAINLLDVVNSGETSEFVQSGLFLEAISMSLLLRSRE